MNRKIGDRPGESRRAGERRISDERRDDGDRRLADLGAPERRHGEERRLADLGAPERRDKSDRRNAENGPPTGWKDRRRKAERRIPAVSEVPFEEWEKERDGRTERAPPPKRSAAGSGND